MDNPFRAKSEAALSGIRRTWNYWKFGYGSLSLAPPDNTGGLHKLSRPCRL